MGTTTVTFRIFRVQPLYNDYLAQWLGLWFLDGGLIRIGYTYGRMPKSVSTGLGCGLDCTPALSVTHSAAADTVCAMRLVALYKCWAIAFAFSVVS